MNDQDKPRYMSQAVLARRFGVTNTAVSNWISRWPWDGRVRPVPEPDAFVEDRPLWLESSFHKWEDWRAQGAAEKRGRKPKRRPQLPSRTKVVVEPSRIVVGSDEADAEANRAALQAMLRQLHASAGWPSYLDLSARTGMSYATISSALNSEHLPERQTLIDLVDVLNGNLEEALRLWSRSRPSRIIDNGWISRILSIVHGKVLQMAAVGTSAEDTAAAMGWTVEGVYSYWNDITERMRVQSMDEAVQMALATGYLAPDGNGVIVLAGKMGRPTQGGKHGYLVYQVAHEVREAISGVLPGTALPTLEELRTEFKTSNTTMSLALKLLKAEGLLAGGGKGHPFVVADEKKK